MADLLASGPKPGGGDLLSSSVHGTDLLGGQPTAQPQAEPQEAIPTNPISFAGHFVGNVLGDVGEIATGITGLISAGAHDLLQAGLHLVPGEQGSEYKDPSYMATMARNFWPAIKHDYATRYGSWSGLLHGLYNDPLSYVSDALIVAGGAGVAAK